MRDTIWVVRKGDEIIGAGMSYYSATREAKHYGLPSMAASRLEDGVENTVAVVVTDGDYTLTREALAAATRVTEDAWSVSRWHVANRGGWIKLDGTTRTNLPQYSRERAEQLAAWWDSVEPNGAPHRVVRVALVEEQSNAGGTDA